MAINTALQKNDFSKGPVWRCIVAQAVPLTIAQLVQLLYNVVDRIYLGHMGDGNSIALTGVGLTFPIISLIMAFTSLFGVGGVPLFSMARGAGDEERASRIMGNSFALLLTSSVILTAVGFVFCRPILFAFGASEESFAYASGYLNIYLIGTVFSMITSGMNGYINAQGFPRIGMCSVIIGAVVNIILDPVFIFVFDMGVAGAALATIISQMLSAVWVLYFLFGKQAVIPLRLCNIRIRGKITKEISKLGASSFIMSGTTFLVQVSCNTTLQAYGGDLYVGIMTVTNSIRDIVMLPVGGIVNGAQPVISFNYGAKSYDRARAGIRFNTYVGAVYTMLAWGLILLFPKFWFDIFSDDAAMTQAGIGMLKLYFFGFVFMALQFAGQSAFQALGDAKHAIFFSLLRKAFIVVPLTLLLPRVGFGVTGVFLAEPISNVIGGFACFFTMRMTAYRRLGKHLIFLGSSVTYGYASKGVSFADFLGKRNRWNITKEAVSGTTLVDEGNDSYVARMKTIPTKRPADLFVCQLSTNDATQNKPLGEVCSSMELQDFDTSTVSGAMEYIIAYAKATWNCPVAFYTNPKYDSPEYAKMVELLYQIAEKWGITVIDLWNDDEWNAITEEQRTRYMADPVHPTREGYLEWWTPHMESALYKIWKRAEQ